MAKIAWTKDEGLLLITLREEEGLSFKELGEYFGKKPQACEKKYRYLTQPKYREYIKKYHKNNKEKINEYNKKYSKKYNNESKKFAEKVKTRWNEEDINIVLEEFMNYSKIADIAKKVKRTNASVSSMIKRLRKKGRIPNDFRNKKNNYERYEQK